MPWWLEADAPNLVQENIWSYQSGKKLAYELFQHISLPYLQLLIYEKPKWYIRRFSNHCFIVQQIIPKLIGLFIWNIVLWQFWSNFNPKYDFLNVNCLLPMNWYHVLNTKKPTFHKIYKVAWCWKTLGALHLQRQMIKW